MEKVPKLVCVEMTQMQIHKHVSNALRNPTHTVSLIIFLGYLFLAISDIDTVFWWATVRADISIYSLI